MNEGGDPLYPKSLGARPVARLRGKTASLGFLIACCAVWDSGPLPSPGAMAGMLGYERCVAPGEVFIPVPATFQFVEGEIQGGWLSAHPGLDGRVKALAAFDVETPAGSHPYRYSALLHGRPFSIEGEISVCTKDLGSERFGRRKEAQDARMAERIRFEKSRMNRLFWSVRPVFNWDLPLVSPVPDQIVITSRFGARRFSGGDELAPHSGVDLRARSGTPIYAVTGGTVALVDRFVLEGKVVILDHGGGLYTLYAHLSRVEVREGQRLDGGDRLGLAGRTGNARGAHLHMGARLMGARIDPMSLLRLGGIGSEPGAVEAGIFAGLHLARKERLF